MFEMLHHTYIVTDPGPASACAVADLVLVIDSSGSIGLNDWNVLLNFTVNFVRGITIGPEDIQVGIVTFGNAAYVQFQLNTYNNTDDVISAVQRMEWRNENTNTSGGLRAMHRDMFTAKNGDRPEAPNIAIVITDGVSTFDSDLTIPEATKAKQKNIKVISVGISEGVKERELVGMASTPVEDFVFYAANFSVLESIRVHLLDAACKAAVGMSPLAY